MCKYVTAGVTYLPVVTGRGRTRPSSLSLSNSSILYQILSVAGASLELVFNECDSNFNVFIPILLPKSQVFICTAESLIFIALPFTIALCYSIQAIKFRTWTPGSVQGRMWQLFWLPLSSVRRLLGPSSPSSLSLVNVNVPGVYLGRFPPFFRFPPNISRQILLPGRAHAYRHAHSRVDPPKNL